MKRLPKISVVIVSYNCWDYLNHCLNSIYDKSETKNWEVIVVDNNSSDKSVEKISKHFKKVKLIKSHTNLGFGKANNLGVKNAKSKLLMLLNPDTILNRSFIKSINDRIDNNELANQIYSCQLNYEDGTVQPNGGYFPTFLRILMWQSMIEDIIPDKFLKKIHPSANLYSHNTNLEWLTGAFMIFSKKDFDLLEGFDPKIFMYGEDLEICYRAKLMNLKIVYDHSTKLTHLQSKSSSSSFALESEVKGHLYFYSKYQSHLLTLIKLLFTLGSLQRVIIFSLLPKHRSKVSIYAKILRNIWHW